jgi:ketosteroid isomerase-like protein
MAEATTTQINADLIRRAYDAFSRGDIEGVFAFFAKDILWHIPGRGPLSGDYRGHVEVQGFFSAFHGAILRQSCQGGQSTGGVRIFYP